MINKEQPFSHLVGNQEIKAYLTRLVKHNSIPQALLFCGNEGIGKRQFALAFARLLLQMEPSQEMHPDLHLYHPEGKTGMHSIHSMRQLAEEVFMAPFEAARKVFIIDDAERMLPTSSNALLKTFEEPPLDAVIVLITSHPSLMLPTIQSRCQQVRFLPLTAEEVAKVSNLTFETPSDEQAAKGAGNELRKDLLEILAAGKLRTYTALMQAARQLADHLEQKGKEEEKVLREELFSHRHETPSAAQSEALEKEIEGMLALKKISRMQEICEIILSWMQDLHVLRFSGDKRLLANPDAAAEIEQALQRGEIIPLETALKAAQSAMLALQRSTSIHMCLERLFLELQFIV